MTTATITNQIKDGSGGVLVGVPVTARLRPGPGFAPAGFEVVDVSTVTDAAGNWILPLEKTDGIVPANSFWEITELVPAASGGPRVWSTIVTADSTLAAAVITFLLPGPSYPSSLTVAAGDLRYGQLGTANTWAGVNTFSASVRLGSATGLGSRLSAKAPSGSDSPTVYLETPAGNANKAMYQLTLRNYDNGSFEWSVGQRASDGHLSFAADYSNNPVEYVKFYDNSAQATGFGAIHMNVAQVGQRQLKCGASNSGPGGAGRAVFVDN